MGDEKADKAKAESDSDSDSDDEDDGPGVCNICGAFLIDSEALASHKLSKHPEEKTAEDEKKKKIGPASQVKKKEDSDSDNSTNLPEKKKPKAGPRSRVKRESSDSETEKDKIKKVSSDSENEKDKGDKLHKTTDTNGAVTKKIKIGPRSQVGPKIDKTDSEGEDIKSDVHAKVKDEKPALDIKDDVKDEKTNS